MTFRWISGALAAALILAVATGVGFTEDKPTEKPAEKPTPMSEGEMWAAMQKLAEPSAMHTDVLAKMVGTWKTTGKMITGMGEIPLTGTSVHTALFDGRFIQVAYKGEFMGSPFVGAGYVGFNNLSKTFEQTWIMALATGMDIMTGTWDAKTQTLTWRDDWKGPDGVTYKRRTATFFKDADTMLGESFATGPDGKEKKEMEMTYTRVKLSGD